MASPRAEATEREASEENSNYQPTEPSGHKRRRVSLACGACRARKSRCDGARPACSMCQGLGFDCRYTASTSSGNMIVGKEYLAALESRVQSLETSSKAAEETVSSLAAIVANFSDLNLTAVQRPQPLQIRSNQELHVDSVDGMCAIDIGEEEDNAFFGPSSNIAFIKHISRALAREMNLEQTWSPSLNSGPAPRDERSIQITESDNGTRISPDSSKNKAIDLCYLPPEQETTELINYYFSDAGQLFPFIHAETFMQTYKEIKDQKVPKVRRIWLGLLNLILAVATSVNVDPATTAEERLAKAEDFYERAIGLCRKQIMQGSSLENIHFLLVLVLYLQGTQQSTQVWIIHGITVRAAFSLGLHCNDLETSFTPIQTEIRKRTWFECIILDRTLSMTFGRPCSIPHTYTKELPSMQFSCLSSESSLAREEGLVLAAYAKTIDLYRIMSFILDSLYGSNLGSQSPAYLSECVSQLFNVDRQLRSWEQTLPKDLTLITTETIIQNHAEASRLEKLRSRLRNLLTLRFLNVRLLLHRPIINSLLELSSDQPAASHDTMLLTQAGASSLQTCVQDATLIITIVHYNYVQAEQRPRQNTLGAWWFSLYYTFNASLIIVASTLASRPLPFSSPGTQPFATTDLQAVETLNLSTAALSALDSGNAMVSRCRSYIEQLSAVLEHIASLGPTVAQLGMDEHLHHISTPFDMSQLGYNMGNDFDVGDFFMGSNFELLQ